MRDQDDEIPDLRRHSLCPWLLNLEARPATNPLPLNYRAPDRLYFVIENDGVKHCLCLRYLFLWQGESHNHKD